jgi:hypothetical protein
MEKILAKKPVMMLLFLLAGVGLYTTTTKLFEFAWREGRVYRVIETHDYTNSTTVRLDGKYDNRRILMLQESQTKDVLSIDVPLKAAPYQGEHVTMRYGDVYRLK